MAESVHLSAGSPSAQRPWDARLARRLVIPLKDSWVTPNHLTTVRLAVGLAAAYAFTRGTYLGFRHDLVEAELDRLAWQPKPSIVLNDRFDLGA
jgi:hypothetical protein